MNRIIMFCIITVHIEASTAPQIDVTVTCASTFEISCSGGNSSNVVWKVFRIRASETNTMVKVIYDESGCHHRTSYVSAQCVCRGGASVICNISGKNIVNSGDQLQCLKVYTGSTKEYKSERVNVLNHQINACTTTTVPSPTPNEESTINTHLDNEASTLTSTFGRVTEETDYNITHESVMIVTTKAANNTEGNKREESTMNPDITRMALLIAGPFVVFDIGLVVFIYRKKLISCLRGKRQVTSADNNGSSAPSGHFNMLNLTSSNEASASTEPVIIRSLAVGQAGIDPKPQWVRNQQLDVQMEECIEDDPLYSRVKDNTALRHASEQNPDNGPNKNRHEDPFDMPLDDDPMYSSVNDHKTVGADEGACGYNGSGQEQSPVEPVYTDVDNIVVHYATVKKDRLPNNKMNTDKLPYPFNATPSDSDNPQYFNVRKRDLHATAHNPIYSGDDTDNVQSMHESEENTHYGDNSECGEDYLYSIVNKRDALNLAGENVAPAFSTVKNENQIAEASNGAIGAIGADVKQVDPLYSVVDKKKFRDMVTDVWNQTVPPSTACSNSAVPTYSKVNKKNKKGQTTIDDSGSLKNALSDDYPYSVVKKEQREDADGTKENRSWD